MQKMLVCCFVAAIILLVVCSHQDSVSHFTVEEIHGDATVVQSGESKSLEKQNTLKNNDVLITGDSSNIRFVLLDGSRFFIGNSSFVTVVTFENKKEKIAVSSVLLENGTVYISKEKSDSLVCEIKTIAGTVRVISGDVIVTYAKDLSRLSISVLNDSATVLSNNVSMVLTSCTHIDITDTIPGLMGPIAESVFLEARQWIAGSFVDAALEKSGCSAQEPVIQQLPPEWIKTGLEICAVGQLFTDTVKATDPEQGKVWYDLAKGPHGLTLDSNSGAIRFIPESVGVFPIRIIAKDSDSMSALLDYTLTVTEGLGVVLSVPKIVMVNQRVFISATPVNSTKSKGMFQYRFDCDGDGVFEIPADSKFGSLSKVEYQFAKDGEYKVTVEIKDKDNRIASAERLIFVKSRPHAVLSITPSFGKAGADFLLDATASSDNQDPNDSLVVRFDIDGDGKWDIPSSTGFLREKKVVWAWPTAGRYNVIIEVVNHFGLSDTSISEVRIGSGLTIDSIIAFDTVHIGDSVQFECSIGEHDYAIGKYEWSMDGDSAFESQTTIRTFKYTFKKNGTFFVLCKATDVKGQVAVYQRTVVVVNAGADVSAGGTYTVRINEPVTLKGAARDNDSKIVSYEWDIDGNGTVDSISKTSSSLTHRFTNSGKKVVYFIVSTDDGAKWKDSAIVIVTNKLPVAQAGDDIVSKSGKKIKLNGSGRDEDQNIVKYEWDFDADGTFDWSSDKTGTAAHVFDTFAFPVFRVTDSDGETDVDTMKVVICPDEMVLVENKNICIDKYEYPGKKGNLPTVNVTFEEAKQMCINQGKRLCSADEWVASCKDGRDRYPYGRSYENDRCNTIGNAYVKNKIAPSGEFSKCAGASGAFDMSGNVAEWVDLGGPYVYGGSYQNGRDETKCDSKVQLQKGKKYFYVGFRCCK